MASAASYSRSNSSTSCENLPPKTLARVGREIRDLHKQPPEGIRLVVDADTGVPSNLGEVLVSWKKLNEPGDIMASVGFRRCPKITVLTFSRPLAISNFCHYGLAVST